MSSGLKRPGEETANIFTHGIGVVLSLIGLVLLLYLSSLQQDIWCLISFSVYGASLIAVYLSSTLYHSSRDPSKRRFFRILDHAAIYLLIAGTYTPFLLVMLRPHWPWTFPYLGLIWSVAGLGVILKILFFDRYQNLAVLSYVVLGWSVVIVLGEIISTVPWGALLGLGLGGLFYSGGVIFYLWEDLPYNHAIWHLFVLGGSLCHYLTIYAYILPTKS